MTVTYDIYDINKPITTISKNEEYGYYVAANNVKEIIDNYIESNEYDHIFVAYKLGENLHKEKIKTGDWIGLGGMTYNNEIGFSNIRVPNENSRLLYKYSSYNTFPEEVFVHEFLHDLERIEEEYGNNVIALHSYEENGYYEDDKIGLKEWYRDYLQSKITQKNLGLSKDVFIRKPVHESNFTSASNITKEYFNEPENLKDEIIYLFNKIKNEIYLNINFIQKKIMEDRSESIRI